MREEGGRERTVGGGRESGCLGALREALLGCAGFVGETTERQRSRDCPSGGSPRTLQATTPAAQSIASPPRTQLPLTSPPWPLPASAGFAFSYVDHTVANLRSSSTDGVSGAAGGCAAGFLLGIRSGSIPQAMGMCGIVGAAVGTYDLAGGQLGWESGTKDRVTREKERLEFFKKRSLPVVDAE